MRVRIKICGMTRPGDAAIAAQLGVDAIGLVFHAGSPRCVSVEQARELTAQLPAFVTVTALFLDPDPEQVRDVLRGTRVDHLQFHGDESPEFCRSFGRPYVKAAPMGGPLDIAAYARQYAEAAALLLDSHTAGQKGGTGRSFDWCSLPHLDAPPLILAGGLTADNVAAAIRVVHPYGVDVSSGVEREPGIKDAEKMAAFVHEVNHVTLA